MPIKLSLLTISSLMTTLALFYFMQYLIAGGKMDVTEVDVGKIFEFVRINEEPRVETIDRTLEKPMPPDELPPKVQPQKLATEVGDIGYSIGEVDPTDGPDIKGSGIAMSDGEYLPFVKVQPVYPRRALSRGMSGWVIVEFTVTEQGMVRDPQVVQNCGWIKSAQAEGDCYDSPNGIFNQAALRAAEKFKYKPQVVNGKPRATAGVQNKITFELVNE